MQYVDSLANIVLLIVSGRVVLKLGNALLYVQAGGAHMMPPPESRGQVNCPAAGEVPRGTSTPQRVHTQLRVATAEL